MAASRTFWTIKDTQPSKVAEWCGLLSQCLDGAEVQFFSTYRVVEAHAWGRARGGIALRSFVIIDGQIRENVGDPSEEEKSLGLNYADLSVPSYFDREDVAFPNEDAVIKLAACWSVDPTTLSETSPEGQALVIGEIELPESVYSARTKQQKHEQAAESRKTAFVRARPSKPDRSSAGRKHRWWWPW